MPTDVAASLAQIARELGQFGDETRAERIRRLLPHIAERRMCHLGAMGVLAECAPHVSDQTRESIESALEDGAALYGFRWKRVLNSYFVSFEEV